MQPTSHPIPEGLKSVVQTFDHVSMAVHDIGATLPLVGFLGAAYLTGGDVDDKGFRWAQLALPGGTKLELISPLRGQPEDHFLVRYLSRHGEGLHHLTFRVDDISAAIEAAGRAGYEVVDVDIAGNWKEAFLHPRSSSGVLIQLAEWDEDDPFVPLEDLLEADGPGATP